MLLLQNRPPCESVPVSADSIPRLCVWAAKRSSPITVFDIETTTFVPSVPWFGITEIALLSVYPNGTASTCSALVDPERKVPKGARELTKITTDDVRGQPTWKVWAKCMHEVANTHVTVGYRSNDFDCPAIIGQNERYGVAGTEFIAHLDVALMPGVSGTLIDASSARGIVSETYHRALPDVWATARLLDALVSDHDLNVLDDHVHRRSGLRDSGPDVRRTQLLEHVAQHGGLPDLEEFAGRYGVKRSTAERDVLRMIEDRILPPAMLEHREVQDWLADGKLETAITQAWQGEAVGRLKPLLELLLETAPKGLDYAQLQLALIKRRRE